VRLIIFITVYCLMMYMVYPQTLASFIASLRNLIAPPLFLLFGYGIARRVKFKATCILYVAIGFFVYLFGLYEQFVNPNFWVERGLSKVWELKGIKIGYGGLPMNVYSSEMVGGQQIRRMISLFADPIHLGAFLFLSFLLAVYLRRKIIAFLFLTGCILTVSKGALLGVLISLVIYVIINKAGTIYASLTSLFCGVCVIAFILFSLSSSTGSMLAHINGFTGAFGSLVRHPFGLGCGNVGVLASLNGTVKSSITESGFGSLIGQIGLVGLLAYIYFYRQIFIVSRQCVDKRQKTILLCLSLSILFNMLFNEVGMSPNSCGPYFICIGIIIFHIKNNGSKVSFDF
ncbi:hypothetical protein, partial [Bifidobacterium moukalabense]|uniref:hypothetical protein n=1 Tax=Bifidobacterium moukalabense TaxID=1333651 RepID=UPI001BB0E723